MKKLTLLSVAIASCLSYGEYVSIIKENNIKYISGYPMIEKEWSEWADVGVPYDCSGLSPLASDMNYGLDFTQSETCKQDQQRTKEIYEKHPTNGEVLVETKTESQTIGITNTQQSTGTKNYVLSTGTEEGSWVNSGASGSCAAWSPDVSTITYGEDFNQSRSCSQDQSREVYTYEYMADGSKNLISQTTETQTTSTTENKVAYGTKPMRMSVAYVNDGWGQWAGFNGSSGRGSLTPSSGSFGSWDGLQIRAASIYDAPSGTDTVVVEVNGNQSFQNLKIIWGSYGTVSYSRSGYNSGGWTNYHSSSYGLVNWLKSQNGKTIDIKISYN